MSASPPPTDGRHPTSPGVSGRAGLGYQLAFSVVGAVLGGLLWVLLSVPQNLINVIFSAFVGIGAGLGAGRLSGAARSGAGTALAVLVAALVLLVTQAVVVRFYLDWATDHLTGAPADPDWDGPVGALRLGLDRAAGRKGWEANGTYFWWTTSLLFAGGLAWFTARPAD